MRYKSIFQHLQNKNFTWDFIEEALSQLKTMTSKKKKMKKKRKKLHKIKTNTKPLVRKGIGIVRLFLLLLLHKTKEYNSKLPFKDSKKILSKNLSDDFGRYNDLT